MHQQEKHSAPLAGYDFKALQAHLQKNLLAQCICLIGVSYLPLT